MWSIIHHFLQGGCYVQITGSSHHVAHIYTMYRNCGRVRICFIASPASFCKFLFKVLAIQLGNYWVYWTFLNRLCLNSVDLVIVMFLMLTPHYLLTWWHFYLSFTDLFFTRVCPSKSFDVLADDFNYMLVTSVLIGMLCVAIVARKVSSRRALKAAWK